MAGAENMRVAVRVRPFNEREKTRSASCIIRMHDKTTELTNPDTPDNEPKRFAYDHSYWSHDGFQERESDQYLEATDSKYIDQQKVFDDLGKRMLDNAWKGYNCSLFAYGQTGSGKSYSIMGYGANKGIVPLTCEELFKGITERQNSGNKENVEFEVTTSMIEIYNEQVKDLLNPKNSPKGGLKVREHQSKGFYVDSLKVFPVNSFANIESKMNEGTRNRTIAATNMNATSSRAHTIVTISLLQKRSEGGQSISKTATINLVDLAGSERADQTGATGDRLKEGSMINQSLTTLGNVIKALADAGSGKKGGHVPYRDSVLTRLLKNALGGNSKTIMIAAISPADINYEETLSTLRYADRAKSIKTKAVINESATDKLIRELREENMKLLQQLQSGSDGNSTENTMNGQVPTVTDDEVEEMKRQLQEQIQRNKEEMVEMEKSWKQRLAEAESANMEKNASEKQKVQQMKVIPHLWNLSEDPALTGMIVHFVNEGTMKIGSDKSSVQQYMFLEGLSIQKDHAVLTNKKTIVKLKPCKNAKVLVNGKDLTEEKELHHNDRVMFGSNHLYVFHHPQDLAKNIKAGKKEEKVTYDQAQAEIAENSGFHIEARPGMSKYDLLLQEDLIQILPVVNEANAMAEELSKNASFKVALISPQARGLKDGRTEVNVILRNHENNNEFMWSRDKFLNRKYIMQEMYQKYMQADEDWDVEKERDPFWEPSDTEVHIGNVFVHLRSLAYQIEMDQTLPITDYRSIERGHLVVELFPCKEDSTSLGGDIIDDPQQLIGKSLNFKLKIPFARGLPLQFKQTFCKYKFYLEEDMSSTRHISGTNNPDYNHENVIKYNEVTRQMLDYIENDPMIIEVWGTQYEEAKGGRTGNHVRYDTQNTANQEVDEFYNLHAEIVTLRKKLYNIQELLEDAKMSGKETVPIDDVDEILGDEYIEPPMRRSRACVIL